MPDSLFVEFYAALHRATMIPSRYGAEEQGMNLYRAADDNFARQGTSFSGQPEHARAYLNNPGFGGSTLWRVPVQPKHVLDLSQSDDPFRDLGDAAGLRINPAQFQHHFPRVLATSDEIADALAARGHHWVKFADDFPEGATTWTPVHPDAVDELDDAEWEEHQDE